MRILLLGEFSGLHHNLQKGLQKLDHEVFLASNGDGWKKIKSDFNWSSRFTGLLGKVHSLVKLLYMLRFFKDFDVVQLISPNICTPSFRLNKLVFDYIRKHNKKVYLVGAGSTNSNTILADYMQHNYKYPIFYEILTKTYGGKLWSQSLAGRSYNKYIFDNIDGYIPIMYEYAEGYRLQKNVKLCSTIPIPIDIDNIIYNDNIAIDKVVIFHGVIREEEKGTPIIREALATIQKKYKDEVEIVIDGNMPLELYLEILDRSNIVVDQLYSVSNGLNALYNLAKGKVVLGGGEIESINELSIRLEDSPSIPVTPNVDDLVSKLSFLIENKNALKHIGIRSREYVEKYHDCRSIAVQYVVTWSKNTNDF